MDNKQTFFLELLTGEADEDGKAVSILEGLFYAYPNGVPLEVAREAFMKSLNFDPGRIRSNKEVPDVTVPNLGLAYFPIRVNGKQQIVSQDNPLYR